MKKRYIIEYETNSKSDWAIKKREEMLFMLIPILNKSYGLSGSIDESKTHKFSIIKDKIK